MNLWANSTSDGPTVLAKSAWDFAIQSPKDPQIHHEVIPGVTQVPQMKYMTFLPIVKLTANVIPAGNVLARVKDPFHWSISRPCLGFDFVNKSEFLLPFCRFFILNESLSVCEPILAKEYKFGGKNDPVTPK